MKAGLGLLALGTLGGVGLGTAVAGGGAAGLDRAHPVAGPIEWRPSRLGIEWAEVGLGGGAEARAIRVTVARIDPRRTSLSLEWGMTAIGLPAWDVDRVGPDASIAFNVGMFVEALPWGWAVVGDGELPGQLRPGAAAIDLDHRDARLALGIDRDGRLLVALTRLAGGFPGADRIPFGLTVPEMAAVMGSLGARQAMLLDGGISAQLAVGLADGAVAGAPARAARPGRPIEALRAAPTPSG